MPAPSDYSEPTLEQREIAAIWGIKPEKVTTQIYKLFGHINPTIMANELMRGKN